MQYYIIPLCHFSGVFKHIFYKYSITAGGVLHEYVGYCADYFAILDNRTSTHYCVKMLTTLFLYFFGKNFQIVL